METIGILNPEVMFSACGIWPRRCTIFKLRSDLGFSGASPGAVAGWKTMVVTAAVLRVLKILMVGSQTNLITI